MQRVRLHPPFLRGQQDILGHRPRTIREIRILVCTLVELFYDLRDAPFNQPYNLESERSKRTSNDFQFQPPQGCRFSRVEPSMRELSRDQSFKCMGSKLGGHGRYIRRGVWLRRWRWWLDLGRRISGVCGHSSSLNWILRWIVIRARIGWVLRLERAICLRWIVRHGGRFW